MSSAVKDGLSNLTDMAASRRFNVSETDSEAISLFAFTV